MRSYIFCLIFQLKKGQIYTFRDWVWQAIFPPECYFYQMEWYQLQIFYLIGLFKSIQIKSACNTSLVWIHYFNTWSNLSQIESTVKTSINTMVFHISYLENERGDPPILLPLWPKLSSLTAVKKIWPWDDFCVNLLKV